MAKPRPYIGPLKQGWKATPSIHPRYAGTHNIMSEDGQCWIANTVCGDCPVHEPAVASLIAAAPDLLKELGNSTALLMVILDHVQASSNLGTPVENCIADNRAAIKKAKAAASGEGD